MTGLSKYNINKEDEIKLLKEIRKKLLSSTNVEVQTLLPENQMIMSLDRLIKQKENEIIRKKDNIDGIWVC